MKKNIFKTPAAKIIFLFLSIVLTTFILGGFILSGLFRIPPQIANLVVIVAILLITWRAYKKEGKNLSELGLNLKIKNVGFGLLGLFIGGLFFIPLVYTIAFIKGYPIIFNQNFNGYYVLSGLWLSFAYVVLEELAFRGICFKKTVEITSVRKANIIFASLFILSHWINLGAFGNPVLMIVLLITGLGHVLYATAFLKSETLYFPIGLHLGNNWVSLFVFSNVDINASKNEEIKSSLITVMGDNKLPVFNGQFILTTIVTAIFFILFIWIVRKWTPNRQQTLH